MYKTVTKSRSPSPVTLPKQQPAAQTQPPQQQPNPHVCCPYITKIKIAESIFSFLLDAQVTFDDNNPLSNLPENSNCALVFREIYKQNIIVTNDSIARGYHSDVNPPGLPTDGSGYLKIMTYNGKTVYFRCTESNTIRNVKEFLERILGILVERQILILDSRELNDQSKIRDIGVDIHRQPSDKIVYLVLRENNKVQRILSTRILDPQFDYDYTNIDDSKISFIRGGKQYKRPCGWERFALKVQGKFDDGDDIWLGSSNAKGEWPVAYHGTDYSGMYGICFNGFQKSFGKRFLYGKAHYTTPNIDIADIYTTRVSYNGQLIRFVLQCRVDPEKLNIVPTPNHGDYWLLPDDDDLRPYGVCYSLN